MSGSSAVRLLQAAAEIVGGESALARQLRIGESLLASYLSGTRLLPDLLLLRAVDIEATAVPSLRVVRRVRDQSGLSAVARAENVHGALTVVRRPTAPIVVVDDIVTTGATLAESLRAFAARERRFGGRQEADGVGGAR